MSISTENKERLFNQMIALSNKIYSSPMSNYEKYIDIATFYGLFCRMKYAISEDAYNIICDNVNYINNDMISFNDETTIQSIYPLDDKIGQKLYNVLIAYYYREFVKQSYENRYQDAFECIKNRFLEC